MERHLLTVTIKYQIEVGYNLVKLVTEKLCQVIFYILFQFRFI